MLGVQDSLTILSSRISSLAYKKEMQDEFEALNESKFPHGAHTEMSSSILIKKEMLQW